jgi:hypothetical protein
LAALVFNSLVALARPVGNDTESSSASELGERPVSSQIQIEAVRQDPEFQLAKSKNQEEKLQLLTSLFPKEFKIHEQAKANLEAELARFNLEAERKTQKLDAASKSKRN